METDSPGKWDSISQKASSYDEALAVLRSVLTLLAEYPYRISLYVLAARRYTDLLYPDLAVGAAYKALLLCDAVLDEADEYHEQALMGVHDDALERQVDRVIGEVDSEPRAGDVPSMDETNECDEEVVGIWRMEIYLILVQSLVSCGCYQTAQRFYDQAISAFPGNEALSRLQSLIQGEVAGHFDLRSDELHASNHRDPSGWPDSGFVRRECYPWNDREPDRLNGLDTLNKLLHEVAPKLDVRVVELPSLTRPAPDAGEDISRQLGVFAAENLQPGEMILDETSLLTANNRLQDALCDACSVDLPGLDDPAAESTVLCPECNVVFCSESCYSRAMAEYHPALCDMDVEAIAKDVPARHAADSLYSLLLLRALAMAETQGCHPLDLRDVKYIWGDFHGLAPKDHWRVSDTTGPTSLPRTLPFSFEHNVRLPLHMLEKMDIDIFANPQYDAWVFNTLLAKFRGTASARLSGRGGGAVRGPEVGAVHFLWCLANHSCDPNVSWEWGGSIKFQVRNERVKWRKREGDGICMNLPGIRQGEEVLNHYCDIDLPVDERREWARGALGGDCRCERCTWEAGAIGEA